VGKYIQSSYANFLLQNNVTILLDFFSPSIFWLDPSVTGLLFEALINPVLRLGALCVYFNKSLSLGDIFDKHSTFAQLGDTIVDYSHGDPLPSFLMQWYFSSNSSCS